MASETRLTVFAAVHQFVRLCSAKMRLAVSGLG